MTTTGKFNAYGSYIQLNTLDDREKITNDAKPIFLGTLPYRRCLCTRRDVVIVTIAFLIFAITVTVSLVLGLPALERKAELYFHPPIYVSSSQTKIYGNASVISDGQMCADIGKLMLEQGGHVVDAAIATLFCNGVVNPESMGLGGGFLMLVYIKETGKTEVIDARETAPAAARPNMFSGNATLSEIGGLAVATPGELRGYWNAHVKYGRLNWSTLIKPSIEICENGFPVSEHMADKLQLLGNRIRRNEGLRTVFINNETNEVYKKGEIFKRPALADTLKAISEEGDAALYEGPLAKILVEDIKSCGGIITEEDLKNYEVKFKDSIHVNLKDTLQRTKTLHTVPLPGSGPILSHILLILDGFGISRQVCGSGADKVLMYHRMIEAFKFGFGYRMKLADDEEDATISQLVYDLTSKEFADKIREKISDSKTFEQSYYSSDVSNFDDQGTSHINVLAPNGDAVAVTSSINSYFGSLCISPKTGIIFNNQMDDFSSPNITNYFEIPPSITNKIKPGRRPLSSMSPSILLNEKGDVELVAGASGGSRIITTIVQAITEILWFEESIKKATDTPRIHHQLTPNNVFYEKHFPLFYRDELMKFGHSFDVEHHSSGFLGILNRTNIQANVDYRRNGSVSGF